MVLSSAPTVEKNNPVPRTYDPQNYAACWPHSAQSISNSCPWESRVRWKQSVWAEWRSACVRDQASKYPSSITHSFCFARRWNTSFNSRRMKPYSSFLRYFGVKTTWYLHSHVLWFRWFDTVVMKGLLYMLRAVEHVLEIFLKCKTSWVLRHSRRLSLCYS